MIRGAILHLDVAQLVLYAFFAFFAGLVWHLRQEDRREGYPLESEADGGVKQHGWLFIPAPKTFHLNDGSIVKAPRFDPDTRPLKAVKLETWPGSPIAPTGDPLLAGVGPGSWVVRPDFPYKTAEGENLLAPLRIATNFAVAVEGPNPLGFTVIAGDRRAAGTVKDLWVDRSESLVRYYEIALGARTAIVPVHFVDVNARARTVTIKAVRADQFASAPAPKDPDVLTLQEEDVIAGYYGGGTLYATPGRAEPLL